MAELFARKNTKAKNLLITLKGFWNYLMALLAWNRLSNAKKNVKARSLETPRSLDVLPTTKKRQRESVVDLDFSRGMADFQKTFENFVGSQRCF